MRRRDVAAGVEAESGTTAPARRKATVASGVEAARSRRRRGLRATTGGIGRAQGERRRAQGRCPDLDRGRVQRGEEESWG